MNESVNETKISKKGRRWIIVLLVIFIPTVLFLGYQLWNASLVISPSQIEHVRIEVNGDSLNSESELFVTFNTDGLHEYSGYWMEKTEHDDSVTLQLYQSFKLTEEKQEVVSIPLDFTNLDGSQVEMNEIEVKGFKSSDTEIIFDSDK